MGGAKKGKELALIRSKSHIPPWKPCGQIIEKWPKIVVVRGEREWL